MKLCSGNVLVKYIIRYNEQNFHDKYQTKAYFVYIFIMRKL